jgi:hypothetical protein
LLKGIDEYLNTNALLEFGQFRDGDLDDISHMQPILGPEV